MATEVLMPKLGLTMTEGTVDQWFKNEGDTVEKGEVVCTISSEKLTHDVEAPEAGVISNLVAVGQEVPCKEPIAVIGAAGEVVQSSAPTPKEETPAPAKEESAPKAAPAPEAKVARSGDRIFITPLARKIAASKGYDISLINGTGGNGRITRRDVEMYQPQVATQASAAPVSYGEGLKGMRKTIAQRMMNSLHQSAQLTIHQKADITSLMAFRKDLKEKADIPLNDGQTSITTLLSRAVILALKDKSTMNAWYGNGQLEEVEAVHLGMAVALDDGLVVPVVEDADKMTLTTLAKTLQDRISKAQDGTLSGEHYAGSTFTITNIGKTGVEYFTPILNTPEVGILGVGTLMSELALEDGQVVQKQKLPLSLTFDHQVIDGAPAADFLARVIFYLEHPYTLVL